MKNIVKCDACEKEFEIKPKLKKHGNGIQETYFNCIHCDRHYTGFVTDADVRRKQRKIRQLGDSLSKITDEAIFQKEMNKYGKMKDELEPLMN